MNNFNKIKLLLINYFVNIEHYKIYKRKLFKNNYNNIYLYYVYNKNFQIIKIVNNFLDKPDNYIIEDKVIINLKKKLISKFRLNKLNIFSIILGKNNCKIIKNNQGDVSLFVNQNNYINYINIYYINFKLNLNNKKTNNITNKQIQENNKYSKNKIIKNLKELSEKLNSNNLIITWILIIFLLFLPFFYLFFKDNFFYTKNLDNNSLILVYGGLNRDLLIWFNQWWRLWTWPLFDTNILILIVNIFFIYNISKYHEVIIGKFKLLIFLIFGIPLVGFVVVTILPNNIFNGSIVILSILWGSLFAFNYAKEDLFSLFSNQRTIIIPVWLSFISLFSLDFFALIIILVALFVGSAFGYLLEYKFNNINISICYPILVICASLIIPLVLINIRTFVPPINYSVINTLFVYYDTGLIFKKNIHDILNNYYHYPYVLWLSKWK